MNGSAFTIKYESKSNKLTSLTTIVNNNQNIEVLALWDTGATCTSISNDVVEKLGLIPIGSQTINTPSGSKTVGTYMIDIILPNKVYLPKVIVCDSDIGNQNLGLLIGMNIISLGDFAVNNFNNKTSFSFCIPSIKRIDFVKQLQINDVIGQKHGAGKRKKNKK